MTLLDEIRQKSGTEFRPIEGATLEQLRLLGVPEDALTFYRDSEPVDVAEIGKVRICSGSQIFAENRDYVPGLYARPCGYVVFATTVYGDAFCFDTRSETHPASCPVVLIAHDLEPENDTMKREDLAQLAKVVAPSFEEFLKGYASEALDIEPLYLDHGF